MYILPDIWDEGKNQLTIINLFKKRDNSERYLECRQRTKRVVWIHHVACKFYGFFHKAPTLYRYWETIIDFKWQKQGSLSSSIGLSQDGACTNWFENLRENSFKKSETYRMIPLSTRLFSHGSISLKREIVYEKASMKNIKTAESTSNLFLMKKSVRTKSRIWPHTLTNSITNFGQNFSDYHTYNFG